ncbi:MAG TPA: hypothetical protein VIY68_01425 [Steroidobacteraceae bacterium]
MRFHTAKAGRAGAREANQAIDPPVRHFTGDDGIIKSGIGGIGRRQWSTRVDPLARIPPPKPVRIPGREFDVSGHPTEDDVNEELESMLPAGLREFPDKVIRAEYVRKRGVCPLVVTGKKNIASTAWREQRRSKDMIEVHVATAPEMARPGSAWSGEQRVEVVYSR